MASTGEIAKFWASVGVKVDTAEIAKVDALLKTISEKFAKFKGSNGLGFQISNFAVDQKALVRALGNALDVASRQVTFDISRFVVNERNLQAAMLMASRRLGTQGEGGRGFGNSALSSAEWNRRQSVLAEAALAKHSRSLELARTRGLNRPTATAQGDSWAGRASVGAIASRAFLPIAAVAAGGYGLSALNKRNQAVVAAQLQSQAVVEQAGGTEAQGKQSYDYLKYQANRIGFNYLEASGDYNSLISSVTGAGGTVKSAQKTFTGFAELSRTNKLSPLAQKRVNYALAQIAGKNQLQSAELTQQLAQALPGAKSIFAQAYQNQLKATGKGKGDLVDADAYNALIAAMKKGAVKGDILGYAGDVAHERAMKGPFDLATQASQAEQSRYQNSISNLSEIASKSGVEEGFSRIFKTLNDGLEGSNTLVEKLSEGFNEATKKFRALALLPQSFQRMLEGKTSFIGNLIGPDEVKQWQDNIKVLNDTWNTLKANLGNAEWATYLKTTLQEINTLLSAITTTINASKWLGEEIASRLHGPAADDPVRLSDTIDRDTAYMNRVAQRSKESYAAAASYQTEADEAGNNGNRGRQQILLEKVRQSLADGDRYDQAASGAKDNIDRWQEQYDAATGGSSTPWTAPQTNMPAVAPTQTTTVTVGDIIVNSSATDGVGVAEHVQQMMHDTIQNALSNHLEETSLVYTKAGR